jgi:hypothetical protein
VLAAASIFVDEAGVHLTGMRDQGDQSASGQRYLRLARICGGGWVGVFGFETVVGGFFNPPGPVLFGGAVGPTETGPTRPGRGPVVLGSGRLYQTLHQPSLQPSTM